MEEIWRKVLLNPSYEISNKNGFRNITRNAQPKGRLSHGYRVVGLGKIIGEYGFHVLVAQAFPEICGEYFEGCHVHHINHNKLDNRPENLIVISSSEHSKIHFKGENNPRYGDHRKMPNISKALSGKVYKEKWKPIIQLSLNGEIIKKWEGLNSINKELGYSKGNISSCCNGKLNTAYGFKWQYAVSN